MTFREMWTVENEKGQQFTVSASSGQDACQQAPTEWFEDEHGIVYQDSDECIVNMRAWPVDRIDEVHLYTVYPTVTITLHAGPRSCVECGELADPASGNRCLACVREAATS